MRIFRNALIAGAIALQLAAVAQMLGGRVTASADDAPERMQVIERTDQMRISGTPGSNRRLAASSSAPVYAGDENESPAPVRIIAIPAASGPERGYDRSLDMEQYRTSWREGRGHGYAFIAGEWHVRYTALFDTAGVETITERNGDGVKQTIVLHGPGAPDDLVWDIETNAHAEMREGVLEFADDGGEPVFAVPPPVAWDADGKPVAAAAVFEPDIMRYHITVETDAGTAWPVTVDPSTVLPSHAGGSVYLYDIPEYSVIRSQIVGYTSTTLFRAGQRDDGYHDGARHYSIYRGFVSFPVPEMMDALACTLFVNGHSDDSEADFDIWVVGAEAYGPAIDGGDFKRFDGWQSSGTYTPTRLNDSWNSASWSSGWNAITFRTEGLDSLLAASGDTLRIAMLSYEDINNSIPSYDPESNEELVSFEISSGDAPYLSISYVAMGPPMTPADIGIPDTGPDWIDAVATTADAYADSILWYVGEAYDGATAYPDTTWRFEGLTPATAYQLQAAAWNPYGASDPADPVQASTVPRVPEPPVIQPLSPNALGFLLDPLDNPSWVEFALQDSVSGRYVDGEASPDTLRDGPPGDWGWRTYEDWGAAMGDTLGSLFPDSLYVLRAKARD